MSIPQELFCTVFNGFIIIIYVHYSVSMRLFRHPCWFVIKFWKIHIQIFCTLWSQSCRTRLENSNTFLLNVRWNKVLTHSMDHHTVNILVLYYYKGNICTRTAYIHALSLLVHIQSLYFHIFIIVCTKFNVQNYSKSTNGLPYELKINLSWYHEQLDWRT